MPLRARGLSFLLVLLLVGGLEAQAQKAITIDDATPYEGKVGEPSRVVVSVGPTDAIFKAAQASLSEGTHWRLYYRGSAIPVLRAAIDRAQDDTVRLEFDADSAGLPDLSTYKKGELTVMYAPPGMTPVIGTNSRGIHPDAVKHGGFISKLPMLTKDKKSADIDVTGSFQTAVSAKPLYYWSAKAAYPVTLGQRFGTIAPTFNGQASQETNADPDSMKADAVYRKVISFQGTRQGLIVDGDLIGYEFERKAKQQAVLVNGKATLQAYQQKNTNLLWSGGLHYVTGWRAANVTLSAGTELGHALTRSVKTTGTTTTSNVQIVRTKLDIDMYKTFFRAGRDKPWLLFDGHYTLRSPFTPEPYQQPFVNGGNQFLTTKPRHYANLNGSFPVSDGVAITLQYKYGSLPPTFTFVDNQVTIGLEVLLKHH